MKSSSHPILSYSFANNILIIWQSLLKNNGIAPQPTINYINYLSG